ncbi:MAG TPA: hypothetical protein VIR02_12930 [Anaerolineales bacterium]
MNLSKRVVISLLIAAIVLFVGLLFWPFILNNIIRPTALVLWLLLRIVVLSIHQKYIWYVAIFVSFFFLFRFLPQEQSDVQSHSSREPNTALINIGYWRNLFVYNGQNTPEEKTLKQELTYLLTSLHASNQSASNNSGIRDALQKGKIPLPGNIHTFLFSQEVPASGGLPKRFFQSIRKTPRQWIRQWTGQEKAEHFQMIDEVLNLMETSLEITNDDRNRSQPQH